MSSNPISLVILDLDGLITETETLVIEIAKKIVESHGSELTAAAIRSSIGRRPLDAWKNVAAECNIHGVTPEQLLDQSEALLEPRWQEVSVLPGARRLINHLVAHHIPIALATSTPRATLMRKLSNKQDLLEAFGGLICCGDDVENGKPHPESFLSVGSKAGVPPEACLVLEDSPSGAEAAAAAGMRCVVVPSLTDLNGYPEPKPHAQSGCVALLPSLLEFNPTQFGFPPFDDMVAGTVPLTPTPWRIKGTVVRGFGRGSKQLGIPTANLDEKSIRTALAEAVTGIYCGWAKVGQGEVHKMVMSVGFNPVFQNKEKTLEPWILHDFDEDFYGEEIRLVVVAYLRAEAQFESVQALIDRIHDDARITRLALTEKAYSGYKGDAFFSW